MIELEPLARLEADAFRIATNGKMIAADLRDSQELVVLNPSLKSLAVLDSTRVLTFERAIGLTLWRLG